MYGLRRGVMELELESWGLKKAQKRSPRHQAAWGVGPSVKGLCGSAFRGLKRRYRKEAQEMQGSRARSLCFGACCCEACWSFFLAATWSLRPKPKSPEPKTPTLYTLKPKPESQSLPNIESNTPAGEH